MEFTKQIFLKYAIQLTSATSKRRESLRKNTYQLIHNSTNIRVDSGDISEQISYEKSAKLFFQYGMATPEKIEVVLLIKKLLSELWFLTYIARNYKTLSITELQWLANKKLQCEKRYDDKLTENKYSITNWLLKRLTSTESIRTCGELLSQIDMTAEEALENISAYFSTVGQPNYCSDVYPASELIPGNKLEIEEPPELVENTEAKPTQPVAPVQDSYESTITSLKSDKIFLESKIHEMEVKMNYMKKDIIRQLLTKLTNPVYGYPLSELYLLSKDDTLSPEVRGTIKNLFSALTEMGIRLVRSAEVGKSIIFDEAANTRYEVYRHDEIKINDQVLVCYPGFRYDSDAIVPPIVRLRK